jgi:transposase
MKQQNSEEITDVFWEAVRPLIPKRRCRLTGNAAGNRERDIRRVLEEIPYVPRIGIQWEAIPTGYGAANSIHRHFRFWDGQGFF